MIFPTYSDDIPMIFPTYSYDIPNIQRNPKRGTKKKPGLLKLAFGHGKHRDNGPDRGRANDIGIMSVPVYNRIHNNIYIYYIYYSYICI